MTETRGRKKRTTEEIEAEILERVADHPLPASIVAHDIGYSGRQMTETLERMRAAGKIALVERFKDNAQRQRLAVYVGLPGTKIEQEEKPMKNGKTGIVAPPPLYRGLSGWGGFGRHAR